MFYATLDYLRNLLAYLKRLHQEQRRPLALESSIISKLPLELILEILSHLPPSSAALFSISCMHLKRLVGDHYLNRLAREPPERLASLILLDRDLPNHIFCDICGKLHKMEEAEYYITTIGLTKDEIPACRKKDIFNSWSSDGVTIIISPNFSTTVFKMAMKRYKLTLECQKLLNCLSDDTGIFYDFYTWRMRTKYRITQGKMIHCLQSFYMPRYFNNSVSFTKYLYIQICQHLKFKTDNKSGRVRAVTKTGYLDHYVTIWETPWDLKREDRNGARSGTLQCRQCSTRFRIAFQYFENYGMAMLFTRLKNLGSGPEDKEWKKHFLPPRVFHPQDTDLQLYTAEVSSLFEVDENPKVDELWADDNRKKLNPAWHNSLASWEQVYKDNISRQKEKEIHGSP